MIYCKVVKSNDVYKVLVIQKGKTKTLSVKEKLADAKELAYALFNLGKVDAVEVDKVIFL